MLDFTAAVVGLVISENGEVSEAKHNPGSSELGIGTAITLSLSLLGAAEKII
jgi:hypothetical protein